LLSFLLLIGVTIREVIDDDNLHASRAYCRFYEPRIDAITVIQVAARWDAESGSWNELLPADQALDAAVRFVRPGTTRTVFSIVNQILVSGPPWRR
jgi:hypothetical protein